MKKYLPIALLSIFTLAIACDKDEESTNSNIEQYYQGTWDITSNDQGLDTTLAININSSGQFNFSLSYGSFTNAVNGNVDNQGDVDGTIKVSTITAGTIGGQLMQSGSGSGNYFLITGDTISWTAVKQ